MEGTRRIVLREPLPSGSSDAYGEGIDNTPRDHVVWAVRESASSGRPTGAEGFVGAEVLGGEWKRIYRFRAESVSKVVDETWKVFDENGVMLDIEAVDEANSGARARWIKIICSRTSSRRMIT